jgi:acyl carrier protein
LEDETGRTISWKDAMTWRTVQDVLDFLEAREEKLFGDLPAGA